MLILLGQAVVAMLGAQGGQLLHTVSSEDWLLLFVPSIGEQEPGRYGTSANRNLAAMGLPLLPLEYPLDSRRSVELA